MAEAANNPLPLEEEEQFQDETLSERFMDWVRTELVWYAGSFSFHLLLFALLLLIPNRGDNNQGDTLVLESKQEEPPVKPLDADQKYDVGQIEDTPPPELDVDPTLEKPAQAAQEAEDNDDSKVFEHKGGGTVNGAKDVASVGGGALAFGPGPKLTGALGIGAGQGAGANMGSGGAGSGFGGRGSGKRQAMLATGGGTKHTERAVTAALVWLAHHQMSDGSWSLQNYTQRCKSGDKSCTGPGSVAADSGGTAMGLLPFLAAGQTHKSKGPYRETVYKGIEWLIAHQKPDGDLRVGQNMYSHGLATIALCEAYGLTGDRQVGQAAQAAANFIQSAQNPTTGGWRYAPGEAGDTSVVGWQIMALKSAHMAGLSVSGSVFANGNKWLDSVASNNGAEYGYAAPGGSPTMTAVGLLCRQYLGAKRDNPMLTGGMAYLMNHLPDQVPNNIYYWYYATQVMHNMSGYEWDTWNRKMRDLLVHTQNRNVDECANGSWNPAGDQFGSSGGRVMKTSLSALTLEIYYRYLPLFKAEAGGGNEGGNAGAAAKGDKPAEAIGPLDGAEEQPVKPFKPAKPAPKKPAPKKAKG